ncbi:sugar transferase [Yoonia sp. F2084L]|nr:sugar transferase [Yoonia sp. F2084L]
MFDLRNDVFEFDDQTYDTSLRRRHVPKMMFDLGVSLILLIPLVVVAAVLLILNPFLNQGPLIFLQKRMGQDCRAFTAIKFRTMLPETETHRGAFDALETDRISSLGWFLRKSRLDELPQILNVLHGEMSLIGPRPDAFDHAIVFLRQVPGYAQRHQMLPGISGYAQTEVGYVEGLDGIEEKVAADLYYLRHTTFWFDLWITWRTFCVVLGCRGS